VSRVYRMGTVYRTNARDLKSETEKHNYNDGDVPQFEVAVFTDGSVAQRWFTASRSMVWWACWDDLAKTHITAHPDYGTRVEWSDGEVQEL